MTQETLKENLFYSNGKLYWKKPGMGRIKGQQAGTRNPDGYRKISVYGERLKEHQLVFLYFNGYIPKEIDHINGVRDDNRIENLRSVTRSQNIMNSSGRSDSKLGVKGVGLKDGLYRARITLDGKQIHLGKFKTLELAVQARTEAAKMLHKEYAR
jgi:hypothetical protein